MRKSGQIKVTIENPCTEASSQMPRTACGMYCNKCQKEVIDFTILTDAELVNILRVKPDACGYYLRSQIDKVYEYREKPTEQKPLRIWAGIAALVSVFSFTESVAQVAASANTQQQSFKVGKPGKGVPVNQPFVFVGAVHDLHNLPLQQMSVTIKNVAGALSDASGYFTLHIPHELRNKKVTFVFGDNEEREVDMSQFKGEAYHFDLNRETIPTISIIPRDIHIMGAPSGNGTIYIVDGVQKYKPNIFKRTWHAVKSIF